MITAEDILNMNFYKKDKFTGSYKGMRYLIEKVSADDTDLFRAHIWPGPYNFASTDSDLKTAADFPFTPEGRQLMLDWLNAQWTQRKKEWPSR